MSFGLVILSNGIVLYLALQFVHLFVVVRQMSLHSGQVASFQSWIDMCGS